MLFRTKILVTLMLTASTAGAVPSSQPRVTERIAPGDSSSSSVGGKANGGLSTVAGGYKNTAAGLRSAIGGGNGNTANANGSTIAGGTDNLTDGNSSMIGGGVLNKTLREFSVIGGGLANQARGIAAVVSGGANNTAAGENSAVPRGQENWAGGKGSFVAGENGNDLNMDHSFVWAGAHGRRVSQDVDTFNVWSEGGIFLNGAIHASSDRNLKDDFTPVNRQEILDRVLEIPITSWRFKSEDTSVRHIGPVAQDFMKSFGFGIDDTHITSTDADGVALVAIQALNQRLEEKTSEVEQLRIRVEALEQQNLRIERLEKRLRALEPTE